MCPNPGIQFDQSTPTFLASGGPLISTVAGGEASLSLPQGHPMGIVFDAAGNLFISEYTTVIKVSRVTPYKHTQFPTPYISTC